MAAILLGDSIRYAAGRTPAFLSCKPTRLGGLTTSQACSRGDARAVTEAFISVVKESSGAGTEPAGFAS
jgi:hypothetical protein